MAVAGERPRQADGPAPRLRQPTALLQRRPLRAARAQAPAGRVVEQRRQSGVTGFRWDVGVTPNGKVSPRQTTGGGTGWNIPAASKNVDEAWPLLQHLLAPDNQKIQAGFFYPSRKSIAEWYANADPQ